MKSVIRRSYNILTDHGRANRFLSFFILERMIFVGMIACNKCKIEYDSSEYYTRPDGYIVKKCKSCHSNWRKEWKKKRKINDPVTCSIETMVNNAMIRVRLGGSKGYKSYKDVEFKFPDRATAISYVQEKFSDDIDEILKKGKVPSIDRIDSNGHYEEGNIRIIDNIENKRLGRLHSKVVSSRKVISYKDGQSQIFESISDASRKIGIPISSLAHRLKGRIPKKDDGFKFEYLEVK